jgi:UDP-N-acetylmuramyl pentapeptide phosphotransferase/UDP-N-acetylglucosamine-1-phosphate transferase
MARRGRLICAAVGALAAQAAVRGVLSAPDYREALARTNFRGHEVNLAGGIGLATGVGVAAAVAGGPVGAAAAIAGLGAGAVGAYDDIVGARPGHSGAKGFRGHLAALREGRVTTGLVKIAGIGAAGLAAALLLEHRRARGSGADAPPGRLSISGAVADVAVSGALIAGTANLFNLFDLRPGRALKVGLMVGAPLAVAGPGASVAAAATGAVTAVLPDDLRERTMLGDAGANALGAVLGTVLAARTGRTARLAVLAGVVGLTAASEKVSFTKVIERTPPLRALDRLGRRTG